jgi:hypothetical protein
MLNALWRRLQRLWIQIRARSNAEVFDAFYASRHWTGESQSGPGSSLKATESIRTGLRDFISENNVESIFDVPCGDFFWMRSVTQAFTGSYIGADISHVIIEQNCRLADDRHKFQVFDLIKDVPPPVDLILCRDLFIHLPLQDIELCLANLNKSAAKHILVTTYPHVIKNTNIKTGDFRPINLALEPFSLDMASMRIVAKEQDSAGTRVIIDIAGINSD